MSAPLDWDDWAHRKRTEMLVAAEGHGLPRRQISDDWHFARQLRAAANARPVAQPNWAALGLGSQHEAEGRN